MQTLSFTLAFILGIVSYYVVEGAEAGGEIRLIAEGQKTVQLPLFEVLDKSLPIGCIRRAELLPYGTVTVLIEQDGGDLLVLYILERDEHIEVEKSSFLPRNHISYQLGDEVNLENGHGYVDTISLGAPAYYQGHMNWQDKPDSVVFQFFSFTVTPKVEVVRKDGKHFSINVNGDVREFSLRHDVLWPPTINVDTKNTHVQLKLKKEDRFSWKKFGAVTAGKEEDKNDKYVDAEIISVEKEKKNACFIKMRYRKLIYNHISVARHIRVKKFDETKNTDYIKPYTTFPEYPSARKWHDLSSPLLLYVRTYPQGNMSKYLCSRNKGDVISISYPYGEFTTQIFEGKSQVHMFTGGSGITPMLSIIMYLLHETSVKLTLHNYNSTADSTIGNEAYLSKLSSFFKPRFELLNYFTRTTGRITESYVKGIITKVKSDKKEDETQICFCGPLDFSKAIKQWLEEAKFKADNIYAFMGLFK